MKKSELRQIIKEEIKRVLAEEANTNLELKNIAKNLYSGLKQKGLKVYLDYSNVKDGQWSATLQKQGSGGWVIKPGQTPQVKGNPVPVSDDAKVIFDDKSGKLNIHFRTLTNKDEVAFVKNVLNFVKGVVDKNYSDLIEILDWNKTLDMLKQMEANVDKGPVGTSWPLMQLRPKQTNAIDKANKKGAVQGATKYKGLEVGTNKDGSTSIYAPGGLWGGQGSKGVAYIKGNKLIAMMDVLKGLGTPFKPDVVSKIETILQSYAKENNLQYDDKSRA